MDMESGRLDLHMSTARARFAVESERSRPGKSPLELPQALLDRTGALTRGDGAMQFAIWHIGFNCRTSESALSELWWPVYSSTV